MSEDAFYIGLVAAIVVTFAMGAVVGYAWGFRLGSLVRELPEKDVGP